MLLHILSLILTYPLNFCGGDGGSSNLIPLRKIITFSVTGVDPFVFDYF